MPMDGLIGKLAAGSYHRFAIETTLAIWRTLKGELVILHDLDVDRESSTGGVESSCPRRPVLEGN